MLFLHSWDIYKVRMIMENSLETKFFEVRDRGTCMPAIGIKMSHKDRTPNERFLLSTSGYGDD
jgi:hypothetical protein